MLALKPFEKGPAGCRDIGAGYAFAVADNPPALKGHVLYTFFQTGGSGPGWYDLGGDTDTAPAAAAVEDKDGTYVLLGGGVAARRRPTFSSLPTYPFIRVRISLIHFDITSFIYDIDEHAAASQRWRVT